MTYNSLWLCLKKFCQMQNDGDRGFTAKLGKTVFVGFFFRIAGISLFTFKNVTIHIASLFESETVVY